MKKLFRTAFCLTLAATFVFGFGMVLAPEADASSTCPTCFIPLDGNGWLRTAYCTDYTDPHCPAVRGLYQNFFGQVCKGHLVYAYLNP